MASWQARLAFLQAVWLLEEKKQNIETTLEFVVQSIAKTFAK